MTKVSATEFCRNFGTYSRKAQREPVEVTSHDRTAGFYISAEDFELYQRLLAASRRAYDPSELPPHLKQAVTKARMDARHKKLNALLDDE